MTSSIDRFTKSEFEQALSESLKDTPYESLGLLDDEYCYTVQINAYARLLIRSSIDASGIAADTGQDSIRLWLQVKRVNDIWFATGKKVDAYTTRVPGWPERLRDKMRILWTRGAQVKCQPGTCKCGRPKSAWFVKSGKNEGRPAAKCYTCNAGFEWLDTPLRVDETKEKKKEKEIERTNVSSTLSGDGEVVSPETPEQPIAPSPSLTDKAQAEAWLDSQFTSAITLDQYQQAVVNGCGIGPQVVEACPGSGKTRTLENLVASLVQSGADPRRIGIFTFSKDAAAEMRWRVARTLWPSATQAELDWWGQVRLELNEQFSESWLASDPARMMLYKWTCTIHALSFRLLKAAGQKLRVLSDRNQWDADQIIKDGLAEFDWKEGPRAIYGWIGWAITNLIQPGQAQVWYAERMPADVVHRAANLAELYRRYYDFCKRRNLVDFDMMQARVVYLLRNDPAFVAKVQGLFDYVLVDEAQDTSPQQAEILFALARGSGNIVLVGDCDQAMYGFRGARPEVLRGDFTDAWEGVKSFNLPVNYRSVQAIVAHSAQLIGENYKSDSEYLKPFQPRPDAPDGLPIAYTELEDFDQLSAEVASRVVQSESPGDWFVLSRTRAECAAIHTALIAAGIPAINKSGGLLFGAPHVRKVLAYARLACNYQNARDNLEVLEEIANVASAQFRAPWTRRRHIDGCTNTASWKNCGCPIIAEEGADYSHSRFYGKKSIQAAGNWDGIKRQRLDRNRGGFPTAKAKGSLDLVNFVNRLEKLQDEARQCLQAIIDDCVLPWLAAEEGISQADLSENGKVEDFQVLLSLAHPDATMEQFLQRVDELSQTISGDESSSVILGTIHWSKGAERERVIVNTTRLPIVPPQRRQGMLPTGSPPSIEEERRLMFVAMTRAKSECLLLGSRKWNGIEVERSRFISEVTKGE